MANKIDLQTVTSGYSTTDLLNENFADIADYINENSLSRVNPDDSADNAMGETLDMNSNPIINLPDAVSTSSPITLGQFNDVLDGVEYAGTSVEAQTATASQTVFTLTSMTYWPGINNLAVYVDGERQLPSAFTETSSSVVTFGSAMSGGEEVFFVANDLVAEADVVDAGNTQYSQGSSGAVTRSIEDKLQESVSVLDFGADPTGASDSYTAFANALAASKAVYVPTGTYLLSQTVDLGEANDGANIYGDGPDLSILEATHSSGPAVRIHERFQRVENLKITASSARTSGSAGTNFGLLCQPEDTFGHNCHDASIENVLISDQPSHGLVIAGGQFGFHCDTFRVEDNLGHGVVVDNGTITSMTNLSRPGSVRFTLGHVNDNTGHAFKIGDDDGSTNVPLRIQIDNVDTFRNALTAGVRKSAHAFWCYMEDSTITRCGFGCGDISQVPTVSALYIAGRDNKVEQPRFIRPIQPAANIDNITVDSISSVNNQILDITVSGPTANLDPAVVIDADASENVITQARVTDTDSVATPTDRSEWQFSQDHYHHQDHYFKSLNSIVSRDITDDGFIDIEFDSDPTYGMMAISANLYARETALVFFRISSTTPDVQVIAASADVDVTTGALTGTTGTNGKLTISAHTDNKLYIENRTGLTAPYNITFMNVSNGSILPAEFTE